MTENTDGIDVTSPMECRRCGTCCRKYQAIVEREDVERIADFLGITYEQWIDRYAEPRWPGQRNFLMRHTDDGCVFLSLEGAITRCEIHRVRPSCCSDWQPSPDKPECREGLEQEQR